MPGLLDGGGSKVDVRDAGRGVRYILGGRYVSLEELATTPARIAERVAVLTNRLTNITMDGVRTLHLKLDATSV